MAYMEHEHGISFTELLLFFFADFYSKNCLFLKLFVSGSGFYGSVLTAVAQNPLLLYLQFYEKQGQEERKLATIYSACDLELNVISKPGV